MNRTRPASTATMRLFFAFATGTALAAGCSAKETTDAPPPQTEPAPMPRSVDTFLADIDLGRDLPAAKTQLEQLLGAPETAMADRSRAKLALSVIAEKLGDHERAIALVEELIEAGEGDVAEKRLHLLLTGNEGPIGPSLRQQELPIAPFARALAKFYPENTQSKFEIETVLFGGGDATTLRLGTFSVDEAVREREDARCPGCEHRGALVHAMTTREGSWTRIPLHAKKLDSILAVFYVDLETPIPARYESYLPIPSSEIAKRLARNEGVIAVKARNDAPPVILVAAPRRAQLADVEEKLAAMGEIPASPVAVPVAMALKPREIQGVMRQSFGRFRGCYEAMVPKASGTATYRFAIRPDGTVQNAHLTVDHSLESPTFEACMSNAIGALTFPKGGASANGGAGTTTVVYPIVFSPDGE